MHNPHSHRASDCPCAAADRTEKTGKSISENACDRSHVLPPFLHGRPFCRRRGITSNAFTDHLSIFQESVYGSFQGRLISFILCRRVPLKRCRSRVHFGFILFSLRFCLFQFCRDLIDFSLRRFIWCGILKLIPELFHFRFRFFDRVCNRPFSHTRIHEGPCCRAAVSALHSSLIFLLIHLQDFDPVFQCRILFRTSKVVCQLFKGRLCIFQRL